MNHLNNIQSQFSIKNLENLSGIKAHTIRIWEKRYRLLNPKRTDTNIRYYDTNDLQKLLNITLLNNMGYKISKIADMSEEEITLTLRNELANWSSNDHYINALKLSMISFDRNLFEQTYKQLLDKYDFREIFTKAFIPLLEETGLLWVADSISPAQEHFLSNLIKQKIHSHIEQLPMSSGSRSKKGFVLFLPLNEIHELGLMYIHYELLSKGYTSVYLGQSVPLESLEVLKNLYPETIFISYFTVRPEKDDIPEYLEDFQHKVLAGTKHKLWLLGRNTRELDRDKSASNIVLFKKLEEILNKIK